MIRLTVRAAGCFLFGLCMTMAHAAEPLTLSANEFIAPAPVADSVIPPAAAPVETSPVPSPSVHSAPVEVPGEWTVEPQILSTCNHAAEYCATGTSHCESWNHCHSGACGHGCKHMKWCHFHTTGDMYPHYAYYPEHHGYYYFRPYNYTTLLEQQHKAVQLGASPINPYSVTMLDPLMAEFARRYPVKEDSYEQVLPQRESLPTLESLLNKNK